MTYRPADTDQILAQVGVLVRISIGARTAYKLTAGPDEDRFTSGLGFILPRRRFIEIRLLANDTYEVIYKRIILRGAKKGTPVVVATFDDIYCDQLAMLVLDLGDGKYDKVKERNHS